MKKKLNIGFDIGTTSVGYCLIEDQTNKIIKMGVRLFEDVASNKDGSLKSGKRRETRSTRRRLNRLKIRKNDLIKWFVDNKFSSSIQETKNILNAYDITKYNVENPVQLKVKALSGKISKEELIIILFHYIQHRGFFYLTQEELKDKKDDNDKIKNEFPSILINDFFKNNGYYKGAEISKNISVRDYKREIEKIFEIQKIEKSILDSYLSLFERIRNFAEGPGSSKSPTPYGLYVKNEDGNIEKRGDNLWDTSIGKCTYYENELRGSAHSPIAEIFNLLNEINNLYFFSDSKQKMTATEKKLIFAEINKSINTDKSNKKDLNLKLISKFINREGFSIYEISGFPINKESKENFTKLKNYSAIIKWMKKIGIFKKDIDLFEIDTIQKANEIFDKLKKEQDADKMKSILEKYIADNNIINNFNDENIKLLKDLSSFSKTHSLSNIAMIDYIKHGLETSENQMIFFQNRFPSKINENFKNKKYIPTGLFDKEIISPTTRRAFNQNVAIMNKIIKFYSNNYEINNITFELARDKNSAEERKSISNIQKKNELFSKNVIKSENIDFDKLNSKNRLKVKLWLEQDKKDLYDQKFIDIKDLLKEGNYEVDHIIPFSICGIDAMYNKVVTKSHLNHEKGNKTPYQYLSRKGLFANFEILVKDLFERKIINKSKRDFLLFKNNPLTEMKQFIERNLVDTRYASKAVLNLFDSFFKSNKDLYPSAKLKVINGAMTNYSRYNQFFLSKDRNDYTHHAVDAAIIAYLGSQNKIQKLVKYQSKGISNYEDVSKNENEFLIIDKETGEVIDLSKDNLTKNKEVDEIRQQIEHNIITNKVFFSRMMLTKSNMQLFNETIYSMKWEDKNKTKGTLISKINLIGENINKKNLEEYFDNENKIEKKQESLICYEKDRNLFDKLVIIFNQFKKNDNQNPFIIYMKEKMNIDNPKFIQIDDIRIKSLKYKSKEKNISNIVKLNSHNNNAVVESLNMREILIFKNDSNKLITIPINIKVLKSVDNKLEIDELKLQNLLIENNISNKKHIIIKNGTILINKETEKLFYAIGGGNTNQNLIEIKSLFTTNELFFGRNQMQISISTISEKYDICKVDVLGNIYERKTFEDFFK
ncbi:MAG: type II CRISPR RNA-guided endonuclease Cas9 [Metamycoplasmataceae bacterium]